MNDEMNEKLLQEYLEGGSPVSEAYQGGEKPVPSPQLDRAVLAEARAAAKASRAPGTGLPRWQNWLMPASLAATVALCIALVAEVVVFDPLLKTDDSAQTFSDALEADAPAASPATAGRLSREQTLMQPKRSADMTEAKQERASDLDEVASTAAMPAEEVPEMAIAGQARDIRAVPEPTSDRPASARARSVQKDSAGEAVSVSSNLQPATVSAGEQAQAGWPAPDVWLAGIRVLREQGEQERANAELVKFREVYPDYPIDDLVQGTDED